MVVILEKGEFNSDFHLMVDFIAASPLRIVPLFDTMLVHQGEGSGILTQPHHTPFPEAETSHLTPSSIPLPSIPTAPIPPDRATIAKSSTLPHDSAPRVTSPAADEGNRFKVLEDKEDVAVTQSGDDAPIKGRSINEGVEYVSFTNTQELFKKVFDQKDNTQDTSANTKFAKQPIVENIPKVGKTNALSNPVTSNLVSTPHESKGVNNDKVITPGMFRINPSTTFRKEKHVPNTVRASARTKPITDSQPPVISKKYPEWSRHITIVHPTKDLHTADYTQLYDFLKYNQKEVDELKVKRLTKNQDPLALMANSNNPYAFPVPHQDQSSFNQNYLQQPMTNPEDITDPTTTMNMALSLMAKAFKLNYSTPTNNNQRISSNPKNRQIAQPGMNMGNPARCNDVIRNQVIQNVVQNPRVQNGLIGVQGNRNQNQIGNGNLVAARAEGNVAGQNGNQIRCYNYRGVGHYARNCTVRPRRRDVAYLQTQLLIAQKEEVGIQLQAEEYDLMATVADLDEIEEVNANCILMANLQQASTSGTQTDSAPVYDTDGSAEVHENFDDNEIFNMFTQEEQYTELLEPIPESHQVPQNDNDVISEDTSVEQGGETVEQHPVTFEETRALYESLSEFSN
nr:hypothetical protein [Tanacetum cinerariifolium]